MGIAQSSRAAACLLLSTALATGCSGLGAVEAFGDAPVRKEAPSVAAAITAEGIPVDETHFPDPVFRMIVQDIAGGDVLTQETIDGLKILDIQGSATDEDSAIADLTGIEHFTALEELNCSYHRLEKLDMSGNPALKTLDCRSNRLTSLNVSSNTQLERLYCSGNRLASIDLQGTNLTDRDVQEDQTIDVAAPDAPIEINAGLTATDADGRPVGADEIAFAENGVLVVKGSGSYVIAMDEGVEESTGRIVIEAGASPTVTLDSLVLRPKQGSAINIGPNAGEVNLVVRGSVVLEPQGNDPLHAGAGIQKENGDATLTVVGEGPGKAVPKATGTDHYPGIGTGQLAVDNALVCKNITLKNLDVTATGAVRAAGIGGGYAVAEVGGITIEGCNVRAKGGAYAAGIGGGWIHKGGSVYDIVVKDSTVEASSVLQGAGIGSGKAGAGPNTVSNVQILHSTVAATGGTASAGIGSGWAGAGTNTVSGIRIDSSDVTAASGYGAAGIGAGSSVNGAATASNLSIANSTVMATGGTCGAGIGSGWAMEGNRVENVSIADGSVQATGNAGCPGIGSGYSSSGDSELVHVVVANSKVIAQGGASDKQTPKEGAARAEEDVRPDFVIGAGAGIGSGLSDKGSSLTSDIVVSGNSNVQATAGDDVDAGGSAPGIGSGPAWRGSSKTEGVLLQGGTVVAQGGTTTADGLGPRTLPGIGAGSAPTRMIAGTVSPADGLAASAWKGASAENAVQFLVDSTETTRIAEVQDAYLRVEFAARPTAGDKVVPSAKAKAKALAATGDGLPPLTVAAAAASAAGAALVLSAATARAASGRRRSGQ